MTTNEETAVDQWLPAPPAALNGETESSEPSALGRHVPGTAAARGTAADSAARPRTLRIGDRVRSFVDDVCVSVGLTGLVVNVAPPRYGMPARARILWDNETVSMADATTFEVLGNPDTTATDDESRVA